MSRSRQLSASTVSALARELTELGYAVGFYSYVPNTRAVRFGVIESVLPAAQLQLGANMRVDAILDRAPDNVGHVVYGPGEFFHTRLAGH